MESAPKIIPPRRPRGRPRIDEPKSNVSTTIPPRVHDKLIRLAKVREVSVSQLVRDILVRAVPPLER